MSMNTVTSSGSLSIDRLLGDAYFTVKAVRDHLEDINKVATLLEDISSSVDGLEATRDQIFVDHIAVLVAGLNHYVETRVAGILQYDVGQFFVSDETGSMRVYKRIPQAPFYEDQGDFLADAIETIVYNTTGHTIDDIQGLQAALDAKANQSHTHTPEQIIGLAALLAEKLELADLSQPGLLLPGSDYRNVDASRVATSRSYPTNDPKTSKSAFAWRSADGAGGHYEFVMNGDGDLMVPGSIFVGVPEYAVWHQGNFEPSDFYTKTAADSRFLQLTGFTWAGLAGKPNTFTPSAHTHSIAEVLGLQTALDGKQAAGSYAAAVHGHIIGDITGLQAALDGKQAAGSYAAAAHTHVIGDVTGLQAALDSKQSAGSYAATSHTHTIADVPGLQAALDSKLNSTSFTWANLSGKPTNISAFVNDAGYITSTSSITGNASTMGIGVAAATDLNAIPAGLEYGEMSFQRYGLAATNKPVAVDNANGVITMISHPVGSVGLYGKQIAFGDNDDLFMRYLQDGTFGSWRTIWHSGSPTISAVNDLRAPLLYDIDNTAFYINAAGTSNINVLSGNGKTIFETSDGFLRLNQWNSFDGGVWLGPSHLGMNGWLHLGSNGNPNNARIQINPGVYNGSNSISVDGGTGNITGSGTVQAGADVRAPLFYDSNNTGFYADPAGTSNLNFLTVAGGDVYRSSWVAGFQSQSDFVDGTLVATDIIANVSSGDSFLIEITGKSYSGSNPPFKVIAQGYIYNDTFINCSGISYGGEFPSSLKVLEQDGVLKIWWARLSYWNSFEVRVLAMNGPTNGNITRNRVTGITNSAEPAVSKKVTIGLGSFVRSDIAASNSVDLRAPIFYDVNNTLFFTDPSSTSRMAYINLNGLNNPQGFRIMDLDGSDYTLLRGPDSAIRFYIGRDNIPTYYDNDAHYFRTDGGAVTQVSITGNGNLIAYVDSRAPVFYDSNDTGFFFDGTGNTNINSLSGNGKNIFTTSDSYLRINQSNSFADGIWLGTSKLGAASGSVLHIGSNGNPDSARVRIIGGTYDGATAVLLDGSNGNISGTGELTIPTGKFRKNQTGGSYTTAALWTESYGSTPTGIAFHISGIIGKFLEMRTDGVLYWNGTFNAETDLRAPTFYDRDDTAYYMNPAGSSRVQSLIANNGIIDPSSIGAGAALGQIIESSTGFSAYGVAFGASAGQHGAIVYSGSTMFFGTENGSDNTMNSKMTLNNAGVLTVNTDVRAPYFYDSDNTGYYLNAAAGSNLYTITVASEMFLAGRAVRRPDSLRYMEFTVGGDANTYYPVIIQNPAVWFDFAQWSISRNYADTAPWDPIGTGVHRGGLTFTWRWSGDGAWGGNDKAYRVEQFAEQYTTMVAGMQLSVNGMIVWLRGGGAYYRLHSPTGMDNNVTVSLTTYTASNGATFAPRSYDSGLVNTEIMSRFPIRNNGQGGELWDGNTRILSEDRWINSKYFSSGGAIYGSIFYDSNDSNYYLDPASGSKIRGLLQVEGDHYDTEIRLTALGSTLGSGVSSAMSWWVSEPNVTWNEGGFGFNVTNDGGTPNGFGRLNTSFGQAYTRYTTSGNMAFYCTDTGGTRYNVMTLWSNNTIGVDNILSAAGSLRAPIFYDNANTGYYLDPASTGTSLNVAGSIVAAGNITAYSDIRVKTNVEPIQAALAKLFGISGVTYNRTDLTDKSKRHAGLIAQEVQEVLPEAVIDTGDKKAVDYNAVIGLLVESIKELKREVDILKSEKGMVP